MADKTDQPKKSWFKRHKILTVVLGIVVVIVLVNMGSGSDKSSNTASNDSAQNTASNEAPAEEETLAKIGEPARDGKFEFVVKGIECGQAAVGSNQYLTATASGQFCSLNMSVQNIGDKSQTMFADNQKLLNASGQEYSYDSTATIYAAPDSSKSSWYSDINPGVTVEGTIVFDIPKDQTPTVAELHDSMASNGINVSLQ